MFGSGGVDVRDPPRGDRGVELGVAVELGEHGAQIRGEHRGAAEATVEHRDQRWVPVQDVARWGREPRERDAAVAAQYAEHYPPLPLLTIQEFGGWDTAQAAYFADGGMFDRAFTPGR